MPRDTAGRAELRHSAEKDDGQSGVEGASVAEAGVGSGTKADRTGSEILIGGEKSFGEAVPAIPQFIHFVRSQRVRIGKRNQLHARGSERIETRQLSASSRQSQRKGLHTVAKEVAPGENVAGVEVLVDLGDEAGQFVERRRNHRR